MFEICTTLHWTSILPSGLLKLAVSKSSFPVDAAYASKQTADLLRSFGISLICLGMDFWLTEEEKKLTENVTLAAFYAWVLVNDYFSFDKEYQNHLENHNEGKMVNAVSLLMHWHDIGPLEAKQLLRTEIIAREQRFVDEKAALNARGVVTTHIAGW